MTLLRPVRVNAARRYPFLATKVEQARSASAREAVAVAARIDFCGGAEESRGRSAALSAGLLASLVALLYCGLSRKYVAIEAEGLRRRCEE